MTVGGRYKNDGVAILKLNDIQREYISRVKKKLLEGIYTYETVPCAVCNQSEFEPISHKDRYGFELTVVVCRHCGLAQTNPRMNQASYNQFYDQEYRFIYGGEAGPTETFFQDQYTRLGKRIYEFIASNNKGESLQGKFILEIGCGAGGILKYFQDRGCHVQGIDLGSQFVEYGKQTHGLNLQTMTIEKLKLDRKPDIIIYNHVLEHILELKSQFTHLKQWMSDSTLLYIGVPGLKNLDRTYNGDLLLYLQNAHVYHFTKRSLLNLMELNGFKPIVIDEFIQSVFIISSKVDKGNVSFINEFESIIKYLKRIESIRKFFPIPPYRMKYYAKRFAYNILAFLKIVPSLSRKD